MGYDPIGEGPFDLPIAWDVDMMAGTWAATVRPWGEAVACWSIKIEGGWIPDNPGNPHTNAGLPDFRLLLFILKISFLLILSHIRFIQIISIWSGKITATEQAIL